MTTGRDFQWNFCGATDKQKVCLTFFSAIFERIGKLKTKTFISDDYLAFYNAWWSVFGPAVYHLICDWQIKRAWTKNISTGVNAIKNTEKRRKVLNDLTVLAGEVDKITFDRLLEIFLRSFGSDSETSSFINYFVKSYVTRKEQWAACYRVHANVNTNMAVERWHKDLKYNSDLKGKCGGRLDKAIHSLMKWLQLKLQGRLVSLERGKLTKKKTLLRKSHKIAQEHVEKIEVIKIEENVFIVPSFSQLGETYKVRLMKLEPTHIG